MKNVTITRYKWILKKKNSHVSKNLVFGRESERVFADVKKCCTIFSDE